MQEEFKSPRNPENKPITEGKGYFEYSDDITYNGSWNQAKRNGIGLLVNKRQGWQYFGSFKDNQQNGFGIYSWFSGDTYTGYFKDNEKSGFGVYNWANGAKYRGYWKLNSKEGLGEYVYPDKSYYFGFYCNDKPDGVGSYSWPDGNYY